MNRLSIAICIAAWVGAITAISAGAQAPPRPTFDHIGVQATCAYDVQTQTFKYQYMVTNPPANTVQIWTMDLSLGWTWNVFGTIQAPEGWDGQVSESTSVNDPQRFPAKPRIEWGTTGIDETVGTTPIPGTTSGPFSFSVSLPPEISDLWVSPWLDPYWDSYMLATGEDEVDLSVSVPLELSLIRKIPTLSPLSMQPGSFEHWNRFLSDVAKARILGWINDSTLFSEIQANLTAARQAAVAQDQTTVNAKLQAVIDAIQASGPSQRTSEAYALVYYNAKYLQQNLPWPCDPKLTLTPSSANHSIGETYTAKATLVNAANDQPIANNYVAIRVVNGPQAGQFAQGTTAADGSFSFTYTGTKVGVDTLQADTGLLAIRKEAAGNGENPTAESHQDLQAQTAVNCTAHGTSSGPITVSWTGGPDLMVIGFIPPVLISGPGQTFYISETTMNNGILPAGPSVTRYYLSTMSPVDPGSAAVVGERDVPALAPGEKSSVEAIPYAIPSNLPAGTYFLTACADADNQVIETNEDNNCALSDLRIVPAAAPSIDCSKAVADPPILWPPNHKLVSVSVTGIVAPPGDSVTIKVASITQDEPTSMVGSGDTCPDGVGVGTSQPKVRAERSGTGNGRIYVISFTASDTSGSSCNGTVTVGVPHDRKDTPIDDGQKYDSTKCQ